MSQSSNTPPLSASPAPLSPDSAHPHDPSSGPMRRKTSRRANTAERRATHNAVERQRRETLNSRFLDLAALLPNLAAVRRPSKSAIVNSSIALIHTQRRQRAIAARELRQLKAESDALRAELNEWRGRAGAAPRVEEIRSAEFIALLTLEDVSPNEEEEIRRAYEMASIPVGDEDDDGYEGGPMYNEPQPIHHAPPPPPPSQQQAQQHAAQLAHHLEQQAQAHMLLQQQAQQSRGPPPGVHIPAFDGPPMFPGPGQHHMYPTQQQQQQYSGPPPGFSPYPPPQQQRSSPQSFRGDPYPREHAQFAHGPPSSRGLHRDDDSVSSSSGGGSPPATGFSYPGSAGGPNSGPSMGGPPTLAAGATPADFARFWAQTGPTKVAAGFPMGFAM